MGYPAVTINGINMFEKYKAPLTELHSVQPPEPKTFFQDIPGGDGSLDVSTVISGRPTYKRREITMKFHCEHPSNQWTTIMSEILKEFHGKEGKIIFEDDPDYYYMGRMTVSDYERAVKTGKFIITSNAEPYKYELLSSLEPWLWDPFNFKKGFIRNYGNMEVSGTKTLTIPGTERWVIPVFTTTGSVRVEYEGKSYDLKQGKSKIYSIVIKQGNNVLKFSGNGKVSVEYRGGIL